MYVQQKLDARHCARNSKTEGKNLMGSKARLHGFKSRLCHLLAVSCWPSGLTALYLHFLICKLGIIVMSHKLVMSRRANACEGTSLCLTAALTPQQSVQGQGRGVAPYASALSCNLLLSPTWTEAPKSNGCSQGRKGMEVWGPALCRRWDTAWRSG